MNKHIRLHSMGTKIFLLFFASILIFVVVLGLVSYNISKTIVMNKSSNGMDQTIVQATQKLDLLFNLYEGLTTQMVTDKLHFHHLMKAG
jgi:methyl-accepting chemotaxis protein